MALSIRARLTLWYMVALCVVLLALGAGLYVANLRSAALEAQRPWLQPRS